MIDALQTLILLILLVTNVYQHKINKNQIIINKNLLKMNEIRLENEKNER